MVLLDIVPLLRIPTPGAPCPRVDKPSMQRGDAGTAEVADVAELQAVRSIPEPW
jgi:hypothetical protein